MVNFIYFYSTVEVLVSAFLRMFNTLLKYA